ncbi:portal protein [Gordonia phage Skog]|uniref:Portal protein n=1 Tax=Gordonia phage Skog TaxID=2704033 RepID=A0A6G6XKK6_9CAUD|nr:portal protein [Gordonia phage Skog]QIG58303.1 portal protein [Gordonia phage Skog]
MTGSLHMPSRNWDSEVGRLRRQGATLPSNRYAAQAEAANMQRAVKNRTLTANMNRQRLAAHTRQATNLQIAMPKIRQPLGSLADKGIPFNVEDDNELKEIRRWARLFYSTHDLIPLLIDIYSKFPIVGLELQSKDPLIQTFYEDMFFGDDLNYMEFLPDAFGREYFTSGEVTSLAHFNESLGVWSSEEILNPDMIRVTKSMFVQRERVQLMVKEMVDALRQGPEGLGGTGDNVEETPSERLQRTEDFAELARHYPELVQAAAQNDGLDISEALISRVVNRTSPWALRGTPHLLRSFRTLMSEESLNAAQDAVADRLYSPMILATLGIPDVGDGEPWIPSTEELEDMRNDMQAAFASDFRFVAHNFGLKIESVFGRESVPNLDNDFSRIDAKLMQAWGIGEALISGGTSGPYASSALNREFVTQMMVGFQNALKRHILKRAAVVAEAQQHFDYDLKGGLRVPIYREIVEYDEETGKEYIRKVPKLLLPEVSFSTLNLRDEAQERAFIAQLKAMGVPISDKKLAVNVDVDFEQELERQSEESVAKMMATAQAMRKTQIMCDAQNLPYPPELAQHLNATLQLRQMKDQTEMADAEKDVAVAQSEMQLDQMEAMEAQGGMGMMPPGAGAPGAPPGGDPNAMGDAGVSDGDPSVNPPQAAGPGAPGPGGGTAGDVNDQMMRAAATHIQGPQAKPPSADGPSGSDPMEEVPAPEKPPVAIEVPRNRTRPAESDSMRGHQPKAMRLHAVDEVDEMAPDPGYIDGIFDVHSAYRMSQVTKGPSSYGTRHTVAPEEVQRQVQRLEAVQRHVPKRHPKVEELVQDPSFYKATNMSNYEGQIKADWPEILAGGSKAQESKSVLDGMLELYYQMYGVEPSW